MPYVLCPLLIIGAIVHIRETGVDWMDVAWLVVGIGGLVFCFGLDVYSVSSRRRYARRVTPPSIEPRAGGE